MEAVLYNRMKIHPHKIIRKDRATGKKFKSSNSKRLSAVIDYLLSTRHQIDSEKHHVFGFGFDGTTGEELADQIKQYEKTFVQELESGVLHGSTNNLAYTDCIDVPNSMPKEQLWKLAEKLHDLAPEVPSVFVLHTKNNKGQQYHHLHEVKLYRTEDCIGNISQGHRRDLFKMQRHAIKSFFEESGYNIKPYAKREALMRFKYRDLGRSFAEEEVKLEDHTKFADKNRVADKVKSPSFWARLANNESQVGKIDSDMIRNAFAEESRILKLKHILRKFEENRNDQAIQDMLAYEAARIRVEQKPVGILRQSKDALQNELSKERETLRNDLQAAFNIAEARTVTYERLQQNPIEIAEEDIAVEIADDENDLVPEKDKAEDDFLRAEVQKIQEESAEQKLRRVLEECRANAHNPVMPRRSVKL